MKIDNFILILSTIYGKKDSRALHYFSTNRFLGVRQLQPQYIKLYSANNFTENIRNICVIRTLVTIRFLPKISEINVK